MRVLISCGEASGEQYALELVKELRARRPSIQLFGVGGELLQQAGVPLWAHREELSVMGFAEVLGHLPRLYRLRRDLERRALQSRIRLFLPIDYGGFHMALAGRLRPHGIRILDFIPPKTWSWGGWRVRSLRKAVDECAVLFEFEEAYYRAHGIEAHWVGHPLVERIPQLEESPRTGLLLAPGSRAQELARIGPVLGEAVRRLRREQPRLQICLSRAPGVDVAWLQPILRGNSDIELSEEPLTDLYRRARAAIVTSGTATLEAALCGTPHLIVYRTSALSYAIARRLATVSHIGMANIVLGRRAFPEYLQADLRVESLVPAALRLLDDEPLRAQQLEDCAELRAALGPPGAIGRLAERTLAMLDR